MQHSSNFSLALMQQSMLEKQVAQKILCCNDQTEKYGLTLSEKQALSLAKTRNQSLTSHKRIEWNGGIIDQLILAFCSSTYLSQDNYEETLHELIDLFYELKDSTWDRIPDQELIEFMRDSFEGECQGTMELLEERAMQLAEHVHCGKDLATFQ